MHRPGDQAVPDRAGGRADDDGRGVLPDDGGLFVGDGDDRDKTVDLVADHEVGAAPDHQKGDAGVIQGADSGGQGVGRGALHGRRRSTSDTQGGQIGEGGVCRAHTGGGGQ